MHIALLQPNPKAGDCFANAALLANMALSAHRQFSTHSEVLCLAPAAALAGYHNLFCVGGFVERCAKAAEALAAMCHTPGLSILIDLPTAEGENLCLIHDGQVQRLTPEHGVAILPGLRLLVVKSSESLKAQGAPASDAVLFWPHAPWIPSCQSQREAVCSAFASRWHIPVMMVQAYGATDGNVWAGQSAFFGSDGRLQARGPAFADCIVCLENWGEKSDPKNVTENCTISCTPGCSVLCADVQLGAVHPDLPYWEAVFQAVVCGIRDYVYKCGLKGIVLGLSGGMDSALVACLAVEAVGAERVLGVLMPSPWSSCHSVSDALALAENLGMQTATAPIESMMNAYDGVLAPLFADLPARENDLTAENIQPRIRGALLMAFANRLDYLVVATGNKSEAAVGYSTLYGDTVGGIAPIGDIYKTGVYTLAQWYNTQRGQEIIPAHVFSKAPSAELRPDQFDQQSLPPYEVLDAILFALLEGGQDPNSLVEFDGAILCDVLRRMAIAEFKRHQMPPVIRLTSCALGADWHTPASARMF